jgi:uncharacterized membrane protein
MFARVRDSHVKSIAKAVSWRILGSIDTFVLSLLVTGSLVAAGSVASLETISKIILYYLHERAWSAISSHRSPCVSATVDDRSVSVVPEPGGAVYADAAPLRSDATISTASPSFVPRIHPLTLRNEDCQHADVDRE